MADKHQTETNPIIFFDGVCGLCNTFVDFLLDRDAEGVFRFAPLQGTAAEELVPAELRAGLGTVVFADNGCTWVRSGAVSRILMRLGGRWKLLGMLLWVIPWPLRDVGYAIVSRLRYRLFGKRDACRLPTPEIRARFLD